MNEKHGPIPIIGGKKAPTLNIVIKFTDGSSITHELVAGVGFNNELQIARIELGNKEEILYPLCNIISIHQKEL